MTFCEILSIPKEAFLKSCKKELALCISLGWGVGRDRLYLNKEKNMGSRINIIQFQRRRCLVELVQ